MNASLQPADLLRSVARRGIDGISAVLLPFGPDERPDFATLATLIDRTYRAGLTPAVNMDTGYVNLLTDREQEAVLGIARDVAAGRRFVAGAFIEGRTGNCAALYRAAIGTILHHGGTPIIFPSSALTALGPEKRLAFYREAASQAGALLAFELGEMFAPFGAIYSLDEVAALMEIPGLVGMKHSSLDRQQEWDRLALRDRLRPDFRIYTGNDLAIDMVLFGSDYLLGLSAFAVEAFAHRDALWRAGDAAGFAVNDVLQYLGAFAFRAPVPAYKHSAAQFLALREVIPHDVPHPRAARRPPSDVEVLRDIARRLDAAVQMVPA